MEKSLQEKIQKSINSKILSKGETIQSLWSGYGSIVRYTVDTEQANSVIVKHIRPPNASNHPRGWNTNLSHQRKLKSYAVETAWYSNWSQACNPLTCRLPRCLAIENEADESTIVLEDLDAAGYPLRLTQPSLDAIYACISWLAHFHATFLGKQPTGLWPTGSYWHLDTRPEELAELDDIPLKNAAPRIDKILSSTPHQTFVHGDAKLANFCFSPDRKKVAAVDFQYVGGGCGMKDLAYFIGSCLNEDQCEQQEDSILDHYFKTLSEALISSNSSLNPKQIEDEWRPLYPIAWTDFHRFLKGWSPGHWKLNTYSERTAQETLSKLDRF